MVIPRVRAQEVVKKDYSSTVFEPSQQLPYEYDECRFSFARLENASITGKFYNCRFVSTSFPLARFHYASFFGCSFMSARFDRTVFRSCKFYNCDFDGVDFSEVRGISTASFDGKCSFSDTKGISATLVPDLDKFLVVRKYCTSSPSAQPSPAAASKEVEPKPLPEVSHYRSPQGKVSEAADDDDDMCYTYEDYLLASQIVGQRQSSALNGWTAYCSPSERHKYGYKAQAVLECPDIEEFRRCKK